ncbi:MAG: hypothetical protein PVI86_16745, partial [Phycisphaerae bacterium]
MARYRRFRRRRRFRWTIPTLLLVAAAAAAWWSYRFIVPSSTTQRPLASRPLPALATNRPDTQPPVAPYNDVPEKGESPARPMSPNPSQSVSRRVESLISTGKDALQRGDLVAARTYLSEAFTQTVDPTQA